MRQAGGEGDADADHAFLGVVEDRHVVRAGGVVIAEDGDGIGGTVVGDRELRLLDRLAAFGVGDELGTGAHHVLAGRQRDEVEAGPGHVAETDPVAAGAAVEIEFLEAAGGDRPGHRTRLQVGDPEAAAIERSHLEIVGTGGTDDLQNVVAAAAIDRGQHALGVIPVDHVVAAVAEQLVDAAAAVDFVTATAVAVAVVAVDDVIAGAAVDLVAVGTAVDGGAADAVVDDVVAAGAAGQEGVASLVAGGQVVVAGVAVQRRLAAAFIDEDIVAVAAMELDVGGHAFLDVDVVVALIAEGDQLLDPLEDGLAAAEHHLDDLAVGVRPQVLDGVELVALAFGQAAQGIARTHVEVEHTIGADRVPVAHVAGRVAGEVYLLGQFDIADSEGHRHADANEQDFHRGIGLDHQRHPTLAGGGDRGADVDPGEGDAEGAQAGAAGEFDQEEEFGAGGRTGRQALAEGDAEMQVGHQAEASAAKHQFAVEREVEVALVVEHAGGLHRHQAEEIHARAELHRPRADALVADIEHEAGVELEHLEEAHVAAKRDLETVALHGDAGQGARAAGGVQLQLARRLDLDHLEHVGIDADIEQQRQAGLVVGVDRRSALGGDGERPQRERNVELDREHVALQDDSDVARSRGETQESDAAADVQLEAGQHGDGGAVGLGQHLLRKRPDVQLDGGAGLERQADVAAEAARQADVDEGGDAIDVEAEHAVDLEFADACEPHLGLGADLDGERTDAEEELETAADLDRAADLEHALQHQVDAGGDADLAEHEEAGLRVGGQDVRLGTRVRRVVLAIGLEGGDGLGLQIRIDLEQELAADRHAENILGGADQRDAADDAGAGVV